LEERLIVPRRTYILTGAITSTALDVNFQEVIHSVNSIHTGNADVAKCQRFAENRMDTHKNARLT